MSNKSATEGEAVGGENSLFAVAIQYLEAVSARQKARLAELEAAPKPDFTDDDFRLWDRALAAAEQLEAKYRAGCPQSQEMLLKADHIIQRRWARRVGL